LDVGKTNVGITNIMYVGRTRKCYPGPVPEQRPPHAPAPSRIRDRPTWLISRAYGRSHGLLNDGFEASGAGLRSYHYRLLAALEEWGPVGQADLGRGTSIDRSDVVTVLGELERLGLIERTVNPSNRRRNIVSITPAGSKQLRALDHVVDEIQEQVLAPLSQTERRQLTKLLRKLADSG
jgi:MarR family transcriptional regulator, lower aerobic nicotinate degradation pathway regulator